MSIQSIEAKLKQLDRERERLSRQLASDKARHFAAIPKKFGYKSIDELVEALAPYISPATKSRLGNGSAVAKPVNGAPAAKVPAARQRYTDQQRAMVKSAIEKGGKTVSQIASESGVAANTVIGWKKKWGLVRKRRARATAKK